MKSLNIHHTILECRSPQNAQIRLRPLTEDDWDLLFHWNNDSEVLYYAEEDDITSYTLDDVKNLYYSVCAKAYCFIVEADCVPIGDAWLQEMNLERVLLMYPGLDVRRIDLAIFEKAYWGQGIGTTIISLLADFGFTQQNADLIYEPGIADYNLGSRRAFQNVGFEVIAKIPTEPPSKADTLYDLALTKKKYMRSIRNGKFISSRTDPSQH
jgi:RimJ/RimL family protein N-acetyltransferase